LRRFARVLPIGLVFLTSLLAVAPVRADSSANDPVDASTRMDIRAVSSDVFWGKYHGHRRKLVRFRIVFDEKVRWGELHAPRVQMLMDSRADGASDYELDIFRQKFSGGGLTIHCWLSHVHGDVVLFDRGVAGYAAEGKVASCSFPKGAMRVRGSGTVRWRVASSYTKNADGTGYRIDRAPNYPRRFFPHL
jgi:hypothetical protein